MQSHHFANKDLYSQSYGLSSDHVQVWELDTSHTKEGWALKNWCFQIVMLEKTLESLLDNKEIKTVNPKRKQLLNIHWKDWCWSWSSNALATWCEELISKDPNTGKDWGQKEKRVAEDEMVR